MKEITRKKMCNFPSKSISAISEFLFIGNDREQLKYSDLVIVLGNDYIEGTIRSVFELYNDSIITDSSRIILSGATGSVNKGKKPECERMYTCAVDEYNMPPHLFFKEPNATNTYENFKYSLGIINNWGGFDRFSNILVIGKAFLLRRASMYAAKFNYPSCKMQYYGTRLSENISRREPEGYLLCLNVPVARTGVQEYLPEELGLTEENGRMIPVFRPDCHAF